MGVSLAVCVFGRGSRSSVLCLYSGVTVRNGTVLLD
jgi:hypothetical protein